MENKTFEEAMDRLDFIVSQLERNEVPLQQALEFFEEGLKLAEQLDVQLRNFEFKIQELLVKHQKEGQPDDRSV